MSILVINIGNSRVAVGRYSAGRIQAAAYGAAADSSLLDKVMGTRKPDGIAVASVVPARNAAWKKLLKQKFPSLPPFWVAPEVDFGMPIGLKNPEQTGVDRYAVAVAGAALCGTPCIVCDFGTMTTFNVVMPRKGFIGGVIVPGYGLWFKAMHKGSAQLPDLTPGGIKRTVGGNTEEAMRLGARWGYRGMVTEIIWQLAKSCGKTDPACVATGGYAKQVMTDAGLTIPVVPDLALCGIGRIFELNHPA